ncbi:MAG: TonB-dependent receptor, partial [Alphaproteobacteria bacterium]|nr:TonB-dependent receptor [Alphaproteobacteria bacterium]
TNRDDNLINMSQGQQVDVDGFYMNADWRLNKGTLHYVGGYREQESRLPNTYTGVGGTLSLFDANRSDDRETTQHELRFTSDFGGNLEFVTGLFYQEDETVFCVTQIVGFLDYFAAVNFANYDQVGGNAYNETPLVLCSAQDQEARAAFIDGSYDISDRFTISAGLRYTEEEKGWIGRNRIAYQFLGGGDFDPNLTAESLGHPLAAADFVKYPTGVRFTKKEWSEESYRLTLSYQVDDNVFTYATYAHGFKSGAFNDQTGTIAALTDRSIAPTDPEFADSMELGVKSDLFDNQLRINAALFRVEYEDAQRQLNTSFTTGQETRFFNAAEITVDGLEVEFTWAPINVPGLNVAGNFSWQDGEFDKFEADTNFDGTVDVDLSGRPLVRAPETQWTLQLAYEHPLMNTLDARFVVTATYEDENLFTHADLGPTFADELDPLYDTYLNEKTLVDVSYGVHNREKGYSITAFVKNATDERYRTASQSVASLWVHTQYGPPRTYGVQLAVEF